jgi:putative transposase
MCGVQEWLDRENGNVLSLETFPRVWKVRRAASCRGGATDSHKAVFVSGVHRHGTSARAEMELREE